MKQYKKHLRHTDRWIGGDLLAEEARLALHDPVRDMDLWRRLYEPTDLVSVGSTIAKAADVPIAEYCFGCTWSDAGIPKSAVAYCISATGLLRGASYAESMTRRQACEAVIGRMRAEGAPILLVVDDGAEGLEVWIDAVASEYRLVISWGRCPGGQNTRTGCAHRVLWAYTGLLEPWGADEWSAADTDSEASWLDRCIERMIPAVPERSAR